MKQVMEQVAQYRPQSAKTFILPIADCVKSLPPAASDTPLNIVSARACHLDPMFFRFELGLVTLTILNA